MSRSIAEIIESLSESDRVFVAEKMSLVLLPVLQAVARKRVMPEWPSLALSENYLG